MCWQPGVLHSIQERTISVLLAEQPTQSRLKVETTTSASIKNSDFALPFPWNVDSGSTKPGFAIVCISPTISYASITIDQACPTWTVADLVCERSNVPLGLFDFTIFFLRDVNQCEPTISWIHFVLCNRVWQWTSDLAQQKISLVCTSSGSSQLRRNPDPDVMHKREFFQKPVDWMMYFRLEIASLEAINHKGVMKHETKVQPSTFYTRHTPFQGMSSERLLASSEPLALLGSRPLATFFEVEVDQSFICTNNYRHMRKVVCRCGSTGSVRLTSDLQPRDTGRYSKDGTQQGHWP